MNNSHFWWYLSRASGIVSWALLSAVMLWGILLTTRMLRQIDRPAWLLDLHRWLGTLSIIGTAVHVVALWADSNVEFSVTDLTVPFKTTWRPWAVAFGIVAMYLLVVVQISSLWLKRIPKKLWRALHLTSYAMFIAVALHSFMAGSDRGNTLFIVFASVLLTLILFFAAIRVVYAVRPATKSRILPNPPAK